MSADLEEFIMALSVNTNVGAMSAMSAASAVNNSMETSMERLSTGKRINAASDDAAGVAIASRLESEIRGTNQAIRNAMDAQALIDTAEGAHVEIVDLLQRMREVAVQAANDTNGTDDRTALTKEMTAMTAEINRIANVTTWAGKVLLDGASPDASKTTKLVMPPSPSTSVPARQPLTRLPSTSAPWVALPLVSQVLP